jgi:excisionase family DNA binding protein
MNPITPTEQDQYLARIGSQVLARLLSQHESVSLHGDDLNDLTLPPSVAHLLQQVLEQVGKGQSLIVLPVESELTTSQAAEIIGTSRPFLVRLLEQGDIPFHMTGTHRRVRLRDVLAYQQEQRQRRACLDALVQEAQELGLGY